MVTVFFMKNGNSFFVKLLDMLAKNISEIYYPLLL